MLATELELGILAPIAVESPQLQR